MEMALRTFLIEAIEKNIKSEIKWAKEALAKDAHDWIYYWLMEHK